MYNSKTKVRFENDAKRNIINTEGEVVEANEYNYLGRKLNISKVMKTV